ncbi:MAG TPA: hypothetical protein VMU88_07405 [bacterium]|nr:hypothetical protein [bacterium]
MPGFWIPNIIRPVPGHNFLSFLAYLFVENFLFISPGCCRWPILAQGMARLWEKYFSYSFLPPFLPFFPPKHFGVMSSSKSPQLPNIPVPPPISGLPPTIHRWVEKTFLSLRVFLTARRFGPSPVAHQV